jgi:hypothetical protein
MRQSRETLGLTPAALLEQIGASFTPTPPSAALLRAMRAYHDVPIYVLAARVGVHPARLTRMLSGRVAMKRDLPDKIATAIRESRTP